ncbi:hypothetical protein HYR99_15585 [Candidatus Poribacteria bacterium]|nr:hypothetical protein [Candidatus Poribacteria bacterium]
MNKLTKAIQAEVAGKIVEATQGYEEILKLRQVPLSAYLNLAFLYWQSTEYGFNAAYHLSPEFIKLSGTRYRQVLQAAEKRFPKHPELQFWRMYFDFVMLGAPPFVEACQRLVSESNCSLVPYFYLYAMFEGHAYQKEAKALLEEFEKLPTFKHRYIASIY